MAAPTYNITLNKGVDYETSITLKDSSNNAINVTSWVFKAEIRRDPDTDVEATFTITKTNASSGIIKLALTDTQTASLPVGNLLYDLVAKDGSNIIKRLLEGTVTVEATVSDTTGL